MLSLPEYHSVGFLEQLDSISVLQGTQEEPGDSHTDNPGEIENEFEDYDNIKNDSRLLARLSKGWTAYLVAVLPARTD